MSFVCMTICMRADINNKYIVLRDFVEMFRIYSTADDTT